MTDYVITEEQLHRLAYFADMLDVESEIRSRPLSEAISSQRHGCLTCFDHTCPVWQTADQNCWKSEKDALKCQTCGGVVTHPMCDKCYWNNIENTCQEALKAERNKLVVEMLSAIPNEGMAVWEERGYLKFINSFRC
jgi:hypothetical protein